MDYQQRFGRTAIERGVPEDEVGEFAGLLRFGIWTNPVYGGVPVGQRGGLPRLPVGMQWPSSESGPLPFVASYDCAALPRVDGLALPADGSLLFFLHHAAAYEVHLDECAEDAENVVREQQYARVVYVPAGTGTVTAEEPEYGDYEDAGDPFVGEETTFFATVTPVLPWFAYWPHVSDSQEYVDCVLPHEEELCALVEELWPKPKGGPFVAIGGYTKDVGHPYGTPEERMGVNRREWTPLAQFSRQRDIYEGRFLIRDEDLAARRFDKALSFTAFTE
ncbi:DUF1963 domain-containing protein [Streptomyces sp. NRRL F-5123]|uniref:DUF1963 domain-containing protein n=1 Tax=Streptomyces sp. NRRL F-5123 TaxID=1463856 RepID=UPI0004E11D34|nr:DUF1963 domain-containing protein [Streptomyces sp. NRRL F-5123]